MSSQPHGPTAFPNPFERINSQNLRLAAAQYPSLERQRIRRAGILATTRRVLAETGHERLTLRRISDECDVAIQTIRNSFGRREDLIVSAVNEHTTGIWHNLAQQSSAAEALIDFADMIYKCAVQAPGYLRGAIKNAFSNNTSLLTTQKHAVNNQSQLLRALFRQGVMRPGIDVELLASQMTRLDTILMYEWSRHGNASELKSEMMASQKTLLRGALRESAAEEFRL